MLSQKVLPKEYFGFWKTIIPTLDIVLPSNHLFLIVGRLQCYKILKDVTHENLPGTIWLLFRCTKQGNSEFLI